MFKLKTGIYKHHKGDKYQVIGIATDKINKSEVVVYKSLKDEKLYSRDKDNFFGKVKNKKGEELDRFEFVEEGSEQGSEEKYLRALADYQNLLRQTAKERSEFVKFAIEDFLHQILPVYDNLKLSLKNLSEEERQNSWVEGVSHVLNQFKSTLKDHGLEEIKTEGEKFNHDEMEAIEGSGDMVKKEVMPGYKLQGKVIRPAKVTVEKK